MKFDYIIGNPPYQETQDKTSDVPIYNLFMDAANNMGDKVELISPARFLFNAGKTPKAWNQKMLNDPHFKVLMFTQRSSDIFENTDIKGGVAVTYRDSSKNYGAIETFTSYDELNSLLRKVNLHLKKSLSEIIYAPESYKFTECLYIDHPEIKKMTKKDKNGIIVPLISKGHEFDLVTNIFDALHNIVFFSNKPSDGNEYIQIVGRMNNARAYMWIASKYIMTHPNLRHWKVILPKSNGSGALGEVLSTPLIGQPLIGHTQTFLSIGSFDSEYEATSCCKYIKTKFARAMLGILKVTQHNPGRIWKYVPLQDFTSTSDIDWSQSVSDVDKQLYKKYKLSDEEIEFIETHVKEME